MKKVILDRTMFLKLKLISDGQNSLVFRYNNRILKIFNPDYVRISNMMGCDIEGKILLSELVKIPSNIIKPFEIIYDDMGNFLGYTMFEANGINFNDYNNYLTEREQKNLFGFAQINKNLENIVRSTPNIVYPDLCTCDNIFIDKKKRIQLIDYDGLQINDKKTENISTTLGNSDIYVNSKKYFIDGLFTKELDIKSLIYLYFLYTFNMNLGKVGQYVQFSGEIITLDYFFKSINLDDDDIKQKVWYLFQEDYKNEYLGDDVFKIAEEYTMVTKPHPYDKKILFKSLVKK